MKALIFFIVVFSCAFLVQAQEQPDKLKSIPFNDKIPGQRDYPLEALPQFEFPAPEVPALTDSIVKIPGYIFGEEGFNTDASAYFNMPISRPGPAFSSNMPIMVPDSSVHFYILQKKIELQMLQQEVKE